MTTEAPRLRNVERAVSRLTQRVDDLQREIRDRAHMAVGTDPKSPRHAPARNKGFLSGLRYEVKRKAMVRIKRNQHVSRVQQVRDVRRSRGVGAAAAMVLIRQPLAYIKTAVYTTLLILLVLAVIWYGWARPFLEENVPGFRHLPRAMENYERGRELDKHLPPGWSPIPGAPWDGVVPGAYQPGAVACPQPVAEAPTKSKGRLEGIAWAFGDKAADVAMADPSAEEIGSFIRGIFFNAGKALGIFQSAAKRAMPEPREPLQVAPRDQPSTQAEQGMLVVPAEAGGEAQAFIDSIVEQESGGSYDAVGPQTRHGRAYGKYQILETNIGPWSQEYLGERVSVEEFHRSPEIQDRIARARLTEYYNRYGARGAAAAWYSGNPDKHLDSSPQSGGPSIKAYVDSVVGRMNSPVTPSPTDSTACGGYSTVLAGQESYGGTEPGPWGGYSNGRIPPEALAALPFAPQHKMRPDAAAAMTAMATAMQAEIGERLVVGNTYRPYDQQVAVAREKGLYSQGGLAAKPGTSDHGWGMAADLTLSRSALAWMRANAARFGYVEDTPRESWHWAFYPGKAVQAA